MDFISLNYNVFLCFIVILYYILPKKVRWYSLLAGSFLFYLISAPNSIIIFLALIILSYCAARIVKRTQTMAQKYRKCIFTIFIILITAPLFFYKNIFLSGTFIAPLGLSFFTLQMIAYVADVYLEKTQPQKSFLKYALFISFFPQIFQGPIPRYEQLNAQLFEGHKFQDKEFVKALLLILWGFFLKLMIADKAAVIVDTVFNNYEMYRGCYVIFAGILYSIQLYTDFLACVTLAQGAAALFGIRLIDNFNHPYFATSIHEFWRRWHISLSTWLRDYIYIPLGGNRNGKVRKYLYLVITFIVSGMWHGHGFQYIVWGLLHAFYQILGALTLNFRESLYKFLGFAPNNFFKKHIRRILTFLLVTLAWIIFRADSLSTAASMIGSIFTVHNPWIFFDDSIFALGLSWKEFMILLGSICVLAISSTLQEKLCIRDKIIVQPLIIRWTIYLTAIVLIYVFGTYGFGFNAQDFIYGGF